MSASDLTVRPAGRGENEELASLVNDAYGRTDAAGGWTSEDGLLEGPRVTAADVRELLERPDGAMLAARLDGELVGCAQVARVEAGGSEIGLLSVRPDRQAEGLGRRILARAEEHARVEQGAERIVLRVLTVRGELIDWYERRGYERTGETRGFEPDEPQRSLVGSLSFEVLEKALSGEEP